jgi:hypothetical protein
MREVGWGLRNRACLEGIGPGGIMLVHVEKPRVSWMCA